MSTDMSTARQNFTRRQIRLESEVCERLEKIALKKFDSKIQRASGRPEITKALNQILKVGLLIFERNLEGNYLYDEVDNYQIKFHTNSQESEIKQRLDLIESYQQIYKDKLIARDRAIEKINFKLEALESKLEKLSTDTLSTELSTELRVDDSNNEKIISKAQLARILGKTKSTCRRWHKAGTFPDKSKKYQGISQGWLVLK